MKKFAAIILTVVLSAFISCSLSACLNDAQSSDDGFTFTDSAGNEVCVNYNPRRVISLQGSFAQTWLESGGTLVGVTSDAYEDLSLNTDAQVMGTVKEPNTEILLSLNPDFVIMSADIAGHKNVSDLLKSAGIPCAFFKQETFDDYLKMLEIFTSLTGAKENYDVYGTAQKERIEQTVALALAQTDKPDVLFVRARSQGVSAKAKDHMVCTILEEFGCINIAAKVPSLLENLSIEQIISEDPDVILVTSMGDENAAKAYLQSVWESNPAWNGLTAVNQHRYEFLQKDLFHFKPNSRWAEAYETLYKILFE